MSLSCKQLPGPGAWFTFRKLAGQPGAVRLRALDDAFGRFGDTLRFHLPVVGDFYVSVNADVARHIAVEHNDNYPKSSRYDELKPALGLGLLTSNGPLWKRQRHLAQPAFHKPRIAALADTMTRSIDEMLNRWGSLEGQPLPLMSEMMAITLTIVARALMGSEVDTRVYASVLSVLLP